MNKKIRTEVILLLFLLTVIAAGCGSMSKTHRKTGTGIRAENFDKFYDRFHSDSAFQMSRIKFPLKGFYSDGTEEKKWTRENWPMMKTRVYDVDTTVYKVYVKKETDSFIQKIWLENSGFNSEYRFELLNGKWYLVYVADICL